MDYKPAHSVEDKRFIEIMKGTIVHEDGHYKVDIPFKSGLDPSLPVLWSPL